MLVFSTEIPLSILVGVSAVVLGLILYSPFQNKQGNNDCKQKLSSKNSSPSISDTETMDREDAKERDFDLPNVDLMDLANREMFRPPDISSPHESSPNSAANSTYRQDEEAEKIFSKEPTDRGELWMQHASWYLADCPRAKRQYSSDIDALVEIILTLKKYDVDPNTGFLPSEDPIQRLPYARYHLWEDLADDLPKLLGSRLGQVRVLLKELPILACDQLMTHAELRRAHLLLSLLLHAYVWGGETPSPTVPRGIAIPLWEISSRLGLPAVLTHTDIILYNWRRLDPQGEICLENLATLNNFFDGRDESWFYLVTVAVERAGAQGIIPIMLILEAIEQYRMEAILQDTIFRTDSLTHQGKKMKYHEERKTAVDAIAVDYDNDNEEEVEAEGEADEEEDLDEDQIPSTNQPFSGPITLLRIVNYVNTQLIQVTESISEMTKSLQMMQQGCLPYIFYHRVRPFLAGWKHNPHLPNGLVYEGVSDTPYAFHGGSAAQSALIPFYDIALGIEHEEVKGTCKEFLMKMREYMLPGHRALLEHLTQIANIRSFVLEQKEYTWKSLHIRYPYHLSDSQLKLFDAVTLLFSRYDACIQQMKTFRNAHLKIVAEYIIAQQQFNRPTAITSSNSSKGVGWAESAGKGKGTGGTELVLFLKPLRDDCQASLIGSPRKRSDTMVSSSDVIFPSSSEGSDKVLTTVTTTTTTKEIHIHPNKLKPHQGEDEEDEEMGKFSTITTTAIVTTENDPVTTNEEETTIPMLASYSSEF